MLWYVLNANLLCL